MRGSEFSDLRAFVAIVEEGNFSRAATRLRISPSTLSQTIRQFEERIGAQLLIRTTRSMSVTEAGQRLFDRFRPALREMEEALGEVRKLQGAVSGTVRIVLPRLALASLVEPYLGDFAQAYPDIHLELGINDAVTDIVGDGFDIGITLGELLEKDMVAVKMGPDLRQIAVAAPEYLARYGTPETPNDLLSHNCINWRKPGSDRIYNWEFFDAGRWYSVAVNGTLTVSHRDTALQAAAQGAGIAFAYWSSQWMQPLIDAGRLVPLLEDYAPQFPGWYLYYARQHQTPASVRAVIDFFRAANRPSDGAKQAI